MNVASHWSKDDTRWYLGVRCQKCRTPILFALDRSEQIENDALPPVAKLVLTCGVNECKHRADYTAAGVSRFQKPPIRSTQAEGNNESRQNRKNKRRS